jgi:hypothetical protein
VGCVRPAGEDARNFAKVRVTWRRPSGAVSRHKDHNNVWIRRSTFDGRQTYA